jgi:hypothetical protein
MESAKWSKFFNVIAVVMCVASVALNIFSWHMPPNQDVAKPTTELTVHNIAAEYRKKGCPAFPFTSVQLISRNPDLILIEGFLTEAEATILIKAAYCPKVIISNSLTETYCFASPLSLVLLMKSKRTLYNRSIETP